MCGIAGYQGNGTDADLRRMIGRIAYRGPDLRATTVRGDTGLAHARLSIIDLSHDADQPMSDANDDLCIVFNGEIYNFKELREELERSRGCRFRTSSDTEVLLQLYREHGAAMLPKLNGMFALAIHDRRSGELFLARDRMGKKPLHYAALAGTFVFGSELKAVVAHPDVSNDINLAALNQYLSFEYVPTPLSIVGAVRKLEPGHSMMVKDGHIVSHGSYWEIDLTTRPISEAEATHRLDAALGAATERRLVSDVPLGIFLSGGIDSSSIAWYAQHHSPTRIKTFSIGFDEASYDESNHADLVARRLGTDHHVEVLTQRDSLDLIEPVYAALDEPFADASLLPTYLLSRFARRHVTVCLGGDGSDELLAGYPTFTADRFRGAYARVPAPVRSALLRASFALPASDANMSFDLKVQQFLQGFELGSQHVNTLWLSSFTPSGKHRVLSDATRDAVGGNHGLEPIDDLLAGSRLKHGGLDEVIFTFLRTYLLDDILFKVDRASMYNSLEVRAPFLDVEVVELINSLPDRYKRRGFTGKWILKKLMRGKLPDAIIDRPKKGFGVPLSAWLRSELRPLCEELLSDHNIKADGIFDYQEIARLRREHMAGTSNHRKKLWTLMVFQLWKNGHN